MRYCPSCGSEYAEKQTECGPCAVQLVTADEMKRRGLPLPHETDTRKFVRAGIAEDPLTAEELGTAVHEANIPVFVRPRRSSSVDMLVDPYTRPWWEILVPEEHLSTATEIVNREKARFAAMAPELERAAEEEEREGELATPHAETRSS